MEWYNSIDGHGGYYTPNDYSLREQRLDQIGFRGTPPTAPAVSWSGGCYCLDAGKRNAKEPINEDLVTVSATGRPLHRPFSSSTHLPHPRLCFFSPAVFSASHRSLPFYFYLIATMSRRTSPRPEERLFSTQPKKKKKSNEKPWNAVFG